MNRMTNWGIGLYLLSTSLAVGQQLQLQPRFPEDTLASQQLIAWSRLQKPQPAPQPLPPRDTPLPQPDSQSQAPARGSENSQAQQQVPTQSFTGKILKDGGKYVLKVSSNTTYQLSEQGDVKQYENQDVKVIGNLDTDSNTIRVVKIELLS
jgi:hypothetical protein